MWLGHLTSKQRQTIYRSEWQMPFSKGTACSLTCSRRTKPYNVPFMTQFPSLKYHIIEIACKSIICREFLHSRSSGSKIYKIWPIPCSLLGGLCACKCCWCCSPKGTRSFFYGSKDCDTRRDFPTNFLTPCKAKPHHRFTSSKSFWKKDLVSALYHIWKKKNVAASKHTNYVISELFFVPFYSLSL